jgi:hypothetical protein
MKLTILILLLSSCSTNQDTGECEFECVDCKQVKFVCSNENREFDVINKKVVL